MPRILIVEDDRSVRENLAELLTGAGYQVQVASNGEEGLALAARDIPDLILCDIMMPVLDGLSLADRLRSAPHTTHIPVIFLTGKAERTDLRAGLDLGAEDYLTKPCRIEKVLDVVRMRLAKRQIIEQRLTESWRHLRREVIADTPPAFTNLLDTIRSYADVISQHSDSLDRRDLRRVSQEITAAAAQLRRLTANFALHFELASLPAGTLPAILDAERSANVGTLLTSIAENCGKDFGRQADCTLTVAPALLQISSPALEKILVELIDNAFRYSRPGTRIAIRGSRVDHHYLVEIEDHGPGITSTRLSQIRGQQCDFLDTPSLELGLQISGKLLSLAGSELRIETKPLQGTVTRFSLPVMVPTGTSLTVNQ